MKDFLLPEKWCIKDSAEVSAWAKRTFFCEGYVSDKYLCVDQRHFPKNNCYHFYDHKYSYAYTEITFEQFKQYVLGMKEEQKEIIGYKLKNSEYGRAVYEISKWSGDASYIPNKGVVPERLNQAGVLDLWFEPVYKKEETFCVGEWVVITDTGFIIEGNASSLDNVAVKITSLEPLFNRIYDWYVSLSDGKIGGSYKNKPMSNYFRKATSEEIAAAQTPQIVVNGYSAKFHDEYVEFGCAKIGKLLFIEANKLINAKFSCGVSNREIESVTIGKGTFTKEQIKQISTYYTK